jgi:hypothetical protein
MNHVYPDLKSTKLYHETNAPARVGETRRYYLEIRDSCSDNFFRPFHYYDYILYIRPLVERHRKDRGGIEIVIKYGESGLRFYGHHISAVSFDCALDTYGYHELELCMRPKPDSGMAHDQRCMVLRDHIYILPC